MNKLVASVIHSFESEKKLDDSSLEIIGLLSDLSFWLINFPGKQLIASL
jgi:hypothetical protein